MKAQHASECLHASASLLLVPNIGPALAADLELLGIHTPRDLIGRDAFVLYQSLCAKTGEHHDPCVLDTFMAAIDFMRGAPVAPWWHYTEQRKLLYGLGARQPVQQPRSSSLQAARSLQGLGTSTQERAAHRPTLLEDPQNSSQRHPAQGATGPKRPVHKGPQRPVHDQLKKHSSSS